MDEEKPQTIHRHRAAFSRNKLSVPCRTAIASGVITLRTSHLDYGCGKGDDVRRLRAMGYDSTGWDNYWFNNDPPKPADVVTLTYVINVIEEPLERVQVLQSAFDLASVALVISVPDWCNKGRTSYKDGFVSQWNVFNKHYSQSELTKFVESSLLCRSHRLGPGIVAVYKQDYHLYSPSEISNLKAELSQLQQQWVPGTHVFLEQYRSSHYFYYRLRSPIADLPGKKGNCKVLHLGAEGSDCYVWAKIALERREKINHLQQEILLSTNRY